MPRSSRSVRTPCVDTERPPCPPGPDRAGRLLQTWAKDASCVDLMGLQTYLELHPDMRFGSVCSGTDISALGTKAFVHWARDFFAQEGLYFAHAFACQKHEGKREFLTALHGRDCHLFADVSDLKSGVAMCLHKNKMTAVPPVRILAGGFPCQDASSLNIHRATDSNRKCVLRGTLRTGGVAAAITDFVAALGPNSPDILILENVAALAHGAKDGSGSGLDALAELLREKCGFLLHTWKLCPRMFGVPQSRARLWMCAFNLKQFPSSLTEQAAHDMLDNLMSGLVGFQMSSISDYLVSKGSRWEANFTELLQQKLDAARPMEPTQNRRRPDAWQKKFREAACQHPYLAGLTPRQTGLLRSAGVERFPERFCRCLDLSQSEGWTRLRDHVPCLTPQGQHYITTRMRPLLGAEALRLQGLFLDEKDGRFSSMSDRLLKDLAGNSFEMSCYMATLWSGLLFLSRLPQMAAQDIAKANSKADAAQRGPSSARAAGIIASVNELTDSE